MRHSGIVHAQLAHQIGLLGHTDRVVVADMGLPLPRHVPLIDLALVTGTVPFAAVLDALLDEIVVQGHVIASEALEGVAGTWFDERADRLGLRTTLDHESFKQRLPQVAFAVRTGEATPYANVILECGVPF
ncbi:D-ribose pyranase [Kineosphaera limosa]|uniref:D-ribose pyranase n=1 Tax=Kineosphaera limosa NBRC 100340 TaxID=1184609 RepID=K6VMD5_9MICO|nr:D-ribose pyranase [Kineosphaera limosa]NYE00635.1 D-ribose pyranase [Kineosphaera limosa]GAB97368.1 ribose transport protein RbsD [Kineosphaera limosa NBRC 100340]